MALSQSQGQSAALAEEGSEAALPSKDGAAVAETGATPAGAMEADLPAPPLPGASAPAVIGLVKLQQEQMSVLDKENAELKETNLDLAHRVRQAQWEAEESSANYEEKMVRLSVNLEETTNLNKTLMEEVSNYRKHLRSLGNAVRISRSSLRPLSAKDVQQKQQMRLLQAKSLKAVARAAGETLD